MNSDSRKIPALIVHQWLSEWDDVKYTDAEHRREPPHEFYVFAMPAAMLRKLSKVYRRRADQPRVQDTAIQRAHDPGRSAEIARFVRYGYPWSDLSERQRHADEFRDLRMPGWLPTAIIVNILPPDARREEGSIGPNDVIKIESGETNSAQLVLPAEFYQRDWDPVVPPLEIIDGQHRLWAFGEDDPSADEEYELPVVAFYDLDVTWQAYLFYIINIKPKRINASLAYDLYPILRIQDWLEKTQSGPAVYRETRAQELTEVLWSHPQSPWEGRINMLGDRKSGPVTQAAFIRSLLASYIKQWEGHGIGGLFGTALRPNSQEVLGWARPQQAAFLVLMWKTIAEAVRATNAEWAKHLRRFPRQRELPLRKSKVDLDAAFAGEYSLISTDQGVRGILQVTNDLCYVEADHLELNFWRWEAELEESTISEPAVTKALASLEQQPVRSFLGLIANCLSEFDWRVASTPELNESQQRAQLVYRGGSGYKELRRQLLRLLSASDDRRISAPARVILDRLGY